MLTIFIEAHYEETYGWWHIVSSSEIQPDDRNALLYARKTLLAQYGPDTEYFISISEPTLTTGDTLRTESEKNLFIVPYDKIDYLPTSETFIISNKIMKHAGAEFELNDTEYPFPIEYALEHFMEEGLLYCIVKKC